MTEFLEPRIVLSSAATANLDDETATAPSMPSLPSTPDPIIAYADGPYRAPHGRAIQPFKYDAGGGEAKWGGLVSLSDNDLGVVTGFATGAMPTHVPATLGFSSSTYSVTDGVTSSNLANIVIESTNRAPETYSWAFNFFGANQSFGNHLAMDSDQDPLTSTVSAALYGTPNVYGAVSSLKEWYYTTTSPASNVSERILVTITDDVGAVSTATLLMGIGLTDPISRLDVRDDVATWGNQWEVATTGNVLRNDFIGGVGDWPGLWTATSSVVWNGTLPNGFTGNSDGSFSFMPLDIGAFMNGSPILVSYTVTDSVGGSGTATLRIKPKVLEPGESASGFGYSVTNGGLSNGGVITNGIAPIMAYPDFTGSTPALQVVCGSLPSYIFSASGPESANAILRTTPAGSLMITASNLTIGNVSSSGLFRGTTDRNIGNVAADSIAVSAGGNIGTLAATKRIVSAVAQGSIGGISAGEHIVNVRAGVDLLGSVSAPNGRVGTVTVDRDILGSVIAFREIGNVTVDRDVMGIVKSTNSSVYQVKVGRDLNGGVSANWDVGSVFVGRDMMGAVSAGHDLYNVEVGHWINSTSAVEAGHTIVTVKVADTILGDVKAGTSGSGGIWDVSVGNDLIGNISSVNTTRRVMVEDELSGNVSSSAGSIGTLQAGNFNSLEIYAYQNLETIRATGTATASGNIVAPMKLQAEIGHIGTVSATNGINAAISAGTSIGEVQAASTNPGLLDGSITAGTWIGPVRSDLGSITALITADTSVNSVMANQDITGDITATNLWIGDVTATKGKISGKIKAKKDVGNVTAGTDILDDIVSTDESIGDIRAGDDTSGSISGNITAGANIASISAFAPVPSPSGTPPSAAEWFSVNTIFEELFGGIVSTITAPAPVTGLTAGHISGNVTATNNIGAVLAQGSLSGNVSGFSVDHVQSVGDISGNISSPGRKTAVVTNGRITGNVSSGFDLFVSAFGDITGALSSSVGNLLLTTWGSVAGALNFDKVLNLKAFGSVSGAITGAQGQGNFQVGGNFSSPLTLKDETYLAVKGDITSSMILITGGPLALIAHKLNAGTLNVFGTVLGYSLESINTNVAKAEQVMMVTWENFTGNVTADNGINIQALGDVNAGGGKTIKSKDGSINISGRNVGGTIQTISAGGSAAVGNIAIVADDVNAQIDAARSVSVKAQGNISGNVAAKSVVSLYSSLNMSAQVSAGWHISAKNMVTAWGAVTGNITAKSALEVFSYGALTGNVSMVPGGSAPNLDVNVTTWGSLVGNVTSTVGDVSVLPTMA